MSGSLIPNAKQQFLDANGNPLAGGFVYYYIPSTTTFKNTYQNAALTILNSNPIILDSAGECIAYGSGSYRQIVTDVNGNLIWDQPTTSLPNDALNVTYTAPFTNAVAETVSAKLSESVSVKDFGAKGDNTTDDTASIQYAINYGLSNGNAIYIPSGTYILNGTLTGGANLKIYGDGVGSSILKKKTASSGHIINFYGTTNKSNIEIFHIEFQVNSIDSGIFAEYVTNFYVHDCAFSNIPYWGIVVGVQNGADATIRNTNVLIENCIFTNITSTYEGVLIFNTQDATVENCRFVTGTNSIGIGIYQNCERISVTNCYFKLHIGMYYSVSCNNITILNCKFDTCDSAIQGANLSDNGAFGATFVQNLIIDACSFLSTNGVALSLGAVRNGSISNSMFYYGRQQGIFINAGGTGVNLQSQNISIISCGFKNNGFSTVGIYTAGILFGAIGGSMYTTISNCSFDDDQGTPTQLYPISFDGAFTYSDVNISNSRVSAYSTAFSIGLNTGTTIGSNIWLIDCQNTSNALPIGVRRKMFGIGTPESFITAAIGSTFNRTDGGAGTTFYVKESGTGNTGWIGK
jgi:hypothetical protein